MASNIRQQQMRKNQRASMPILEDNREFKRIKYSLKMALRMVNGHFTQFSVQQFNQSGINFDNAHDKTQVESWVQASGEARDAIQKNQGVIFGPKGNFIFKVGSIIKKPEELTPDVIHTFFLFKIVIGRAAVHKGTEAPE